MASENDDLPGDEPAPVPELKVPVVPAPKEPAPKVEPVEATPAPKKNSHTERLTRIALQMGFSQADLDNHDSATIWEEVNRIQTLANASRVAKEPAKPAAPVVDEDEDYIKELEANPENDPKHIAFLKRQHARTKAAEAKAGKVDALEARDKQRNEQDLIAAAESAFAELAKRDPKAAILIGTGAADELDPGELGWRRHIWQNAGATEADSPAVLKRKLIAVGGPMLAKKTGATIAPSPPVVPPPPPAPAKKPLPPRGQDGKFTEADYEAAKLPQPGNRTLEGAPELVGAAAIHSYLREIGDPRAGLSYVDRDDADDLPDPGQRS